MIVNEEKRAKFMEFAGKRVNNVMHDMQILEPMARSAAYDFTRQDVEEMFAAMQETLNSVKAEYEKKFEEKARIEKKVFAFGQTTAPAASATTATVVAEVAMPTTAEVVPAVETSETLESVEVATTDTTTF